MESQSNTMLFLDFSELQDTHRYCSARKVVFDIVSDAEINIPDEMFYNCENLESVIFHNRIGNIGAGAFFGCDRLRNVQFEQTVQHIEKEAFANTPLTVVYLKNDTKIDDGAFDNCGDFGETLTLVVNTEFPEVHRFAERNGIGYSVKKTATAGGRARYPITIETENLSVIVNRKKRILSNISLKIEPGEMIMIIGGSGTGKSTLVKHLFGLEQSKENLVTVHANGKKATGNPSCSSIQKLLKNKVFYAPQFTVSNENLTVEQEIQKNALMFRGSQYDADELEKLSRQFSLWDDNKKLLQTLVKRISGGQKKKLLMACSQASNPQIFVFDEPDSGLDEPSAFNLFIQDLRENQVNKYGKTVIVISHHPHNFMNHFRHGNRRIPFDEIFTRLIVLAKEDEKTGGTIAFSGTPLEAKRFFGLNNDPYSRIVSLVMPKAEGGESTPEEIRDYICRYRVGGWKNV